MKEKQAVPDATVHAIPARRDKVARMTIIIPAVLDQNLEIYRVRKGISKNEAIKKAVEDLLRADGLQPDKSPREFTVTY